MVWTFDIGWIAFFLLLALMGVGCFLMKRRMIQSGGCVCNCQKTPPSDEEKTSE